jgi:circadian clock protein KaiB
VITYVFRIYVMEGSPTSVTAMTTLRTLCEASVPGRYEIEVVDVLDRPELAEEHGVLATPTVDRLAPLPARRVMGDLSDPHRAAAALELPSSAPDRLVEGER